MKILTAAYEGQKEVVVGMRVFTHANIRGFLSSGGGGVAQAYKIYEIDWLDEEKNLIGLRGVLGGFTPANFFSYLRPSARGRR